MSKTNRDRSLYFTVAVILLILVLSGVFLGKTASKQFDEQYQERLRSGLTTYGVVLNYTYDGFNHAMHALSADAKFLSVVENGNLESTQNALENSAVTTGTDALYLIDHQGNPTASYFRPGFTAPGALQCFSAVGGMVATDSMLYLTNARKLMSSGKLIGYLCGMSAVTEVSQSESLENLLRGTPYLSFKGRQYFFDATMRGVASNEPAELGEMVRWSGHGKSYFGMSGALALGNDEVGIGILVANDIYRENIRLALLAIGFSLMMILLMGLFALRTMARQRRTQRKFNQAKEQALVTLSSIGDSVITTDAGGSITFINTAAAKLLQLDAASVINQQWQSVIAVQDSDNEELLTVVAASQQSSQPIFSTMDTELLCGERIVPVRFTAARISRYGSQSGTVIVLHDVSKERSLREELAWRANHDELTRLPNRSHFHEKVTSAIQCIKQRQTGAALLFLDLDKFKTVNDTCGHDAGDQLLIQVCALFSENLRADDTLARLGGDEFGVVLSRVDESTALGVAEKLIESLKQFEFNYEGQQFKVGVSIGLVMLEDASDDLTAATRKADEACYAAKESGRNRCCLYSELAAQSSSSGASIRELAAAV